MVSLPTIPFRIYSFYKTVFESSSKIQMKDSVMHKPIVRQNVNINNFILGYRAQDISIIFYISSLSFRGFLITIHTFCNSSCCFSNIFNFIIYSECVKSVFLTGRLV
ncbi:hypothetical protein AO268_08900 [Pseudomonas sp. ICMP 8385]|nr:hypothetical protein AO268_08900 [Pseudomonas sp. ICMP 8385]